MYGWCYYHTCRPCGCSKIAGKTFSSDLRKPCLITGESLSPPTKIGTFHEKSLAKLSKNGMRSLHLHIRREYGKENVGTFRWWEK